MESKHPLHPHPLDLRLPLASSVLGLCYSGAQKRKQLQIHSFPLKLNTTKCYRFPLPGSRTLNRTKNSQFCAKGQPGKKNHLPISWRSISGGWKERRHTKPCKNIGKPKGHWLCLKWNAQRGDKRPVSPPQTSQHYVVSTKPCACSGHHRREDL